MFPLSNQARDGHCVARIDAHRFIVAGGFGGDSLEYIRDIVVFDERTQTFTTVGFVQQQDMTGQVRPGVTRFGCFNEQYIWSQG